MLALVRASYYFCNVTGQHARPHHAGIGHVFKAGAHLHSLISFYMLDIYFSDNMILFLYVRDIQLTCKEAQLDHLHVINT